MSKAKKPKKRGLELTAALRERICRQISLGQSLRRTLKAAGMPSMTRILKGLSEHPEFAAQYARAKRIGIELHVDAILDLAATANDRNAHAVRLRVDTLKWIASKLLPKVYGDHLELEIPLSADDGKVDRLALARQIALVGDMVGMVLGPQSSPGQPSEPLPLPYRPAPEPKFTPLRTDRPAPINEFAIESLQSTWTVELWEYQAGVRLHELGPGQQPEQAWDPGRGKQQPRLLVTEDPKTWARRVGREVAA